MKPFALTGRLMAGKTWLGATFCGRSEASLAEPLYALARIMIGSDDKKSPGVREFLQQIGQWGRGTVSDQYPRTIERRCVSEGLRVCPETFLRESFMPTQSDLVYLLTESKVDWSVFGMVSDIWVEALAKRLKPGQFVSNCRFQNEMDAFNTAGIPVYHVTARPETLRQRWDASGTSEKALKDISEELATKIDIEISVGGTAGACSRFGLAGVVFNDEGGPDTETCLTVDRFRSLFTTNQ